MTKQYVLIFFTVLVFISLKNHAQYPKIFDTDTLSYPLFNQSINIVTHHYHPSSLNFLIVHDNENTGTQAALEFMQLNGGRLVELQYGDQRNINFQPDSTTKVEFDPNRMFTFRGLYVSLLSEGGITNQAVMDSITLFADSLLTILHQNKPLNLIIAIHNNTDENYSINSYKESAELKESAAEVFINPDMDADDFILVTDKRFFDYLKTREINVLLQSDDAPDDGSLSIYAVQKKIPYINIEAQHEHLDEQRRLIGIINAMVEHFKLKEIN